MNPSRFQVTSTLMNNRPLSVFYIYQLSHTPVRLNCSRIYERATSTDFSKHQPCLCLCFGFSQITLILPFLLMILHFSQIGFTDDLTFTVKSSFHRFLPEGILPPQIMPVYYSKDITGMQVKSVNFSPVFPGFVTFTGWVACTLDLCVLQRCADWSGQRSRFIRHRRTYRSEWDGQNGFDVRYIPYERRAQRSRAQTATRPLNSPHLICRAR